MIATLPTSEAASHSQPMTPESATELLKWSFTDEDQRVIAMLSAKARDGALTPQESERLENYLQLDDMMSLAQTEARLVLRRQGPGV